MNKIKCGFAQKVITPQGAGIFQDGYGFRMSPAEGVHDDLYVKAAVFGIGKDMLFAILVLDVCGLNQQLYELVTDYIEGMTGLDRAHVAVCATHTHAGPACGVLEGLPLSYDFWGQTAELCGRAVLEAREGMRECTCAAAIADKELLSSFNRRNRPFIDRRIKASAFMAEDGTLLGVIASACCHPVINTTLELSADYPQVLTRRALETYSVPFLFLQGTCADINPLMPKERSIAENTEQIGGELADGVMEVVTMARERGQSVTSQKSAYQIATIPMKAPAQTQEDFGRKLEDYIRKPWSVEKHIALHYLEWSRKMRRKAALDEAPQMQVPLQAFSLDRRVIFVFLPFEAMTETGRKIEDMLRGAGYEEQNIFVIGYANSVNGYLAPLEELPIGGYEVTDAPIWYGLPACSELTEKAVIEAVKETALSL